jgi:Ser/Thr protein kinase RdoA (MazF antagonist)
MKPFEQLTTIGQVRRLRHLGVLALEAFGMPRGRLKLIQHLENTTFCFDLSGTESGRDVPRHDPYRPGRLLLRIHRTNYQTPRSIASELDWLAALRQGEGLVVPDPVVSPDGKSVVIVQTAGVPEPRACSLLRWIDGRVQEWNPTVGQFNALGELMARLHNHAASWQRPAAFERRHLDWEGLFGDNAGFASGGAATWARVPQAYRSCFEDVAKKTRHVMDELGNGADDFGLIHADLHTGNVVLRNGGAYPIDFDDCGFAHWVYDIGAPLIYFQDRDDWPCLVKALLRGYARRRPLPTRQLNHLHQFMAARHVSFALWEADRAQEIPSFRTHLQQKFARAAADIDYLQSIPSGQICP